MGKRLTKSIKISFCLLSVCFLSLFSCSEKDNTSLVGSESSEMQALLQRQSEIYAILECGEDISEELLTELDSIEEVIADLDGLADETKGDAEKFDTYCETTFSDSAVKKGTRATYSPRLYVSAYPASETAYLRWSRINGAQYYDLYRITIGKNWLGMKTYSTKKVYRGLYTGYVDRYSKDRSVPALTQNKEYQYRVVCRYRVRSGSGYTYRTMSKTITTKTKSPSIALPQVKNLRVTKINRSSNGISFQWNPLYGVDGYEIEKTWGKTGKAVLYASPGRVYDMDLKKHINGYGPPYYTHTNIVNQKGYDFRYRVRAYKLYRGRKYYGPYSNQITTYVPDISSIKFKTNTGKTDFTFDPYNPKLTISVTATPVDRHGKEYPELSSQVELLEWEVKKGISYRPLGHPIKPVKDTFIVVVGKFEGKVRTGQIGISAKGRFNGEAMRRAYYDYGVDLRTETKPKGIDFIPLENTILNGFNQMCYCIPYYHGDCAVACDNPTQNRRVVIWRGDYDLNNTTWIGNIATTFMNGLFNQYKNDAGLYGAGAEICLYRNREYWIHDRKDLSFKFGEIPPIPPLHNVRANFEPPFGVWIDPPTPNIVERDKWYAANMFNDKPTPKKYKQVDHMVPMSDVNFPGNSKQPVIEFRLVSKINGKGVKRGEVVVSDKQRTWWLSRWTGMNGKGEELQYWETVLFFKIEGMYNNQWQMWDSPEGTIKGGWGNYKGKYNHLNP